MERKLDVNVVDIKKEPVRDIILSPGEDVYIKNVTSKNILIHIKPKLTINDYWEFFKHIG